ncbi:heavy metal translocating P-type ATPase [Microvirga sp. W0021]|uniref:Heavy metal translocating P-type ATPase n=1 Tax=Hohaiivirga grylli TaxID=3133970 RepID=A0ABV0BNB9_9HYPH
MAEMIDLSLFVQHREDGAVFVELAVDGITGPDAIHEIEGGLERIDGVLDARLNYTNHRVKVAWKADQLDPAIFLTTLKDLGYRAYPHIVRSEEEAEARKEKWLLRCLGIAGFASMNIMLLSISVWAGNASEMSIETRDMFHWISALIALPTIGYAGQPFFRSAFAALRERRLNMDVPIVVAIILAMVMSVYETLNHAQNAYFDSGVMLLFFLLCGRTLEQAMRRKTRAVAGNLAALKSETAYRLDENGQAVLVPVGALQPNDKILVRSGERVPVDGLVVQGTSQIDESMVTGETLPRNIETGATVYAGSSNYGGAITVQATAIGEDTLLDEIERLLEKASSSKSRYIQLADRVGSAYAPVIHTTALITLCIWLMLGASFHDAILTAVAVLIITCPCALALAVPVVQVVASGNMFRAGLLLNAGDAIERLAKVDTVVFDKTGTLTLPELQVANRNDIPADLLEIAARLAISSHHPLSAAVATEAKECQPYDQVEEIAGEGVRAIVNGQEARLGSYGFCGFSEADTHALLKDESISIVAIAYGAQRALLAIHQALRPDAVATLQALRKFGIHDIRIMSGDRPEAVRSIADKLGVADWHGSMKPADKIRAIEELQTKGASVLMVGDGLNDAPALAAASVSLSPISASNLAQVHADAVFLGDRLMPVFQALATARKARSLMRQNLGFALLYNLVAVPLAFLGHVTPLVAALAMSGSSLVVTLNGLRVRRQVGVGTKAQEAGTVKETLINGPLESSV